MIRAKQKLKKTRDNIKAVTKETPKTETLY